LSYTAILDYSEEYIANQKRAADAAAKERRDAQRSIFNQTLSKFTEELGLVSFSSDIKDFVIQVDGLLKELQKSGYSFPSIEIEIKKLVYKAGEKQQELYQQENIKNMIED
jgi:hypothetical protein